MIMQGFKMILRPCGFLSTAAIAAVPIIKTEATGTIGNGKEEKTLVRPSQLPIYVNDDNTNRSANVPDCPPTMIEEGFGTVRRAVQGFFSEYTSITENLNNKFSTGYEHTMLTLDYLREESNIMPRLGAVAIGGLTGLVFSLRGGKFKRLVYTSTGALSVAAVCYPKQAHDSLTLAKHYANIGYNFVYGVKPGDANQLAIKWPEIPKISLPTSASDLVDMASNMVAAVGSLTTSTAPTNTDTTEGNRADKPKSN